MTELVNKYKEELTNIKKSLWDNYAKAFDKSILYIKNNKDIPQNLKIPSLYIVKEIHLESNFNQDEFLFENIENTIIEFIKYYEEEYENYINGFALISDQEFTDICFYDKFIKKHQQ